MLGVVDLTRVMLAMAQDDHDMQREGRLDREMQLDMAMGIVKQNSELALVYGLKWTRGQV